MSERLEKYLREIEFRVDKVNMECYRRYQDEHLRAFNEAQKEAYLMGLDAEASNALAPALIEEHALLNWYIKMTFELWEEFFAHLRQETAEWSPHEAKELFVRMSQIMLRGNPYSIE